MQDNRVVEVSASSCVWAADATSHRSTTNEFRRHFSGRIEDSCCVLVQTFVVPGGQERRRRKRLNDWTNRAKAYIELRILVLEYSLYLFTYLLGIHLGSLKGALSRLRHEFVSPRYASEMSGPLRQADITCCEGSGLSDDVPFVDLKHSQSDNYMSINQACACPSVLIPVSGVVE